MLQPNEEKSIDYLDTTISTPGSIDCADFKA